MAAPISFSRWLAGENLGADEDYLDAHSPAIQQQLMNRIAAIPKPGNGEGHDRTLVGSELDDAELLNGTQNLQSFSRLQHYPSFLQPRP